MKSAWCSTKDLADCVGGEEVIDLAKQNRQLGDVAVGRFEKASGGQTILLDKGKQF